MLVLQVIPVYVAETASKGLRSSMNNVTNISQVKKIIQRCNCLLVCLSKCIPPKMNDMVERWPRPPLHVLSPPALATSCCSPARFACHCPRLPPEPS